MRLAVWFLHFNTFTLLLACIGRKYTFRFFVFTVFAAAVRPDSLTVSPTLSQHSPSCIRYYALWRLVYCCYDHDWLHYVQHMAGKGSSPDAERPGIPFACSSSTNTDQELEEATKTSNNAKDKSVWMLRTILWELDRTISYMTSL